jgi:hypothetical protein
MSPGSLNKKQNLPTEIQTEDSLVAEMLRLLHQPKDCQQRGRMCWDLNTL